MIALILVAALLVTPVMAAGYDAVELYDDIPMIVEPELDTLDLEDESVVCVPSPSIFSKGLK